MNPIKPGSKYEDQKLTIGDTDQKNPILWVPWRGLLIADQCVCTNISWDQLNGMGYIFGHPVRIGDKPYLCRSFKVGSK